MDVIEKIGKRLDKMMLNQNNSDEAVFSCLHRLQEAEINLDILTKTGIGIRINKVRKETRNPEIKILCKKIIKQWKKLVPGRVSDAGGKRSPPLSGDDSSQHGPPESKRSRRPANGDHESRNDSDAGSNHARGFFMSKNLDTDDPVRQKAREMIQKAMEDIPPPSGAFEAEYLAIQIENAIFNLFKSTDPKYKQRVRTRVMNLRDSNNPNLRINVFMGHVRPERLATMTSEEMASKDMKALREKYNKETIDDYQMTTTGGTESEILQCGKCKQKRCTYNQVQTRSADEPMTTFVYCNSCGHRWKFC